ncbi:MAG TPA: hypothetical protein VGM84_21450 [Steroidobacteraceae bacterium]|jgi:hypothetical protein
MSPRTLACLSVVLAVIAVGLPPGAQGDMTVQEQLTLSVAAFKAQVAATESLSGDKRRTDVDVRCDAGASVPCARGARTEVVRLDRDVLWNIESRQRRYTEVPLSAGKAPSCPVARAVLQVPDISKCELSEPHFTTDKTAEVLSIAGHSARLTHLRLAQTCKKGQPGPCEVVYSLDVWLTPGEIAGLGDRAAFQRRYQTRIGTSDASTPVSTDFQPYLSPYAGPLQQLYERAADLRGYPLKSVFRASFSGTPCGAVRSQAASSIPAPLANAGSAAATAAASSSEYAAGWSTAHEVERSTGGNSVGSYVAGSTAGAFAGRLVGGLLTSRHKEPARPVVDPLAVDKQPPTTLAEFSVETTSINVDTLPGDRFEIPSGWSQSPAKGAAGSHLPMCQNR